MTSADGSYRNQPTEDQEQRGTILARMAHAILDQNWAAVAVEILIVVVGVVIGFQATAWGENRTDEARELVYLEQLAADLGETERRFTAADSFHVREVLPAASKLIASFGHDPKPPPDSLGNWFAEAWDWQAERPVLGTARALVATGDLSLIRNDSLRSAILTYIESTETALEYLTIQVTVADRAGYEIAEHLDLPEWLASTLPDSARAEMSRRYAVTGLIPRGDWVAPFPLEVDAFYTNRGVYASVFALALGLNNFVNRQRSMLVDATALRTAVERATQQRDRPGAEPES